MGTKHMNWRNNIGFVASRFLQSRDGSVAMLLGLSLIPLMLAAGGAIDYGRLSMAKSQLQKAADTAVLAAGAKSKLTQLDRQKIATNVATTSLGAKAQSYAVNIVETEPSAGTFEVKLTATVPTTVMKVAGITSNVVSVTSQAKIFGATATKPLEIALALDNTGSMIGNMVDLKLAANQLVDTVMDAGGNVRVSVVPYVAAVNPGLTDMSMVDTTATTPWNGVWQRGVYIAYDTGCVQNWGTPPSSGGAGAGGSGDGNDIIDILNPFRRIAGELFGITAAHADVTPSTAAPMSTIDWTSPATGKTYKVPTGWSANLPYFVNPVPRGAGSSTGGCEWLANPHTVSHYDLFHRIPKPNGDPAQWKGCVEARTSLAEQTWINANWGATAPGTTDYGASDAPPVAGDPLSTFTPYFWPDEPDYSPFTLGSVAAGPYSATSQGFHNNYLREVNLPPGWGWTINTGWAASQWIHGYDGVTRAAIIQETPDGEGRTYGPNAGCPDAVLRLTNDKSTVKNKINNLKYWMSGGTIISEGLAWAWRSLSPNAPYADGKPYNTPGVQKVIVLMTDGVNELFDNGNNATTLTTNNISDYSAYGYLGAWRLAATNNIKTYAAASAFFDERLLTACANAKAAGVKIYTVTFNHGGFLTTAQQNHAADMLRQCASQPDFSYLATDSGSLVSAFTSIALSATATPLRLTR